LTIIIYYFYELVILLFKVSDKAETYARMLLTVAQIFFYTPLFKAPVFSMILVAETANSDLLPIGFCNEPLLGGE